MKDWWSGRSGRERLVMQVAGLLIAMMLAWAFILYPMSERQSALHTRIAAQGQALQQLAEARQLLAAGASGTARSGDFGDRSMASVIEQGLRGAGLAAAIRRIEPAGDGSVSLVLEAAAFDPLVAWLQDAAVAGITVLELSLDRSDSEGAVNARLRLAAGT